MDFKIGDLVKIITQPKHVLVNIKDNVCIIDNIIENIAEVVALDLDGSSNGFGSVQLSCLEHEINEHWIKAKQKYFDNLHKLQQDAKNRTEKYKQYKQKIADKYNLSVDIIENIYSDMNDWENNI